MTVPVRRVIANFQNGNSYFMVNLWGTRGSLTISKTTGELSIWPDFDGLGTLGSPYGFDLYLQDVSRNGWNLVIVKYGLNGERHEKIYGFYSKQNAGYGPHQYDGEPKRWVSDVKRLLTTVKLRNSAACLLAHKPREPGPGIRRTAPVPTFESWPEQVPSEVVARRKPPTRAERRRYQGKGVVRTYAPTPEYAS